MVPTAQKIVFFAPLVKNTALTHQSASIRYDAPMSSTINQQPIARTVGKRVPRDGQPLTQTDRDAMAQMARYRTRAPKGVFFYNSHDEMIADRERWTVDAVVAQQAADKK
jgi:hypothetical protein